MPIVFLKLQFCSFDAEVVFFMYQKLFLFSFEILLSGSLQEEKVEIYVKDIVCSLLDVL